VFAFGEEHANAPIGIVFAVSYGWRKEGWGEGGGEAALVKARASLGTDPESSQQPALTERFMLATFHYRHLGARVFFIPSKPTFIASDSGRLKPVRSMQFGNGFREIVPHCSFCQPQ
jgi:hypothetical protein